MSMQLLLASLLAVSASTANVSQEESALKKRTTAPKEEVAKLDSETEEAAEEGAIFLEDLVADMETESEEE